MSDGTQDSRAFTDADTAATIIDNLFIFTESGGVSSEIINLEKTESEEITLGEMDFLKAIVNYTTVDSDGNQTERTTLGYTTTQNKVPLLFCMNIKKEHEKNAILFIETLLGTSKKYDTLEDTLLIKKEFVATIGTHSTNIISENELDEEGHPSISGMNTSYWYFSSVQYKKGFRYKDINLSLEEFANIAHSYVMYDKDFEVLEQTAMGTLEHPVHGETEYWIFATTDGWEMILKNATHYGYLWKTVYHGASAPITDDERTREWRAIDYLQNNTTYTS